MKTADDRKSASAPAVLFGQRHAEQARFARFAPDLAGDLPVEFPLRVIRRDLTFAKAARGLPQQRVFVREHGAWDTGRAYSDHEGLLETFIFQGDSARPSSGSDRRVGAVGQK